MYSTWGYPWRPSRNCNRSRMQQYVQFWIPMVCPSNTGVSAYCLSIAFWVHFKGMVITFEALHGTRPDYMWDHLSLRVSGHPTRLDRVDVFQIPSLKCCYLMGLWRHAPTFKNSLPSRIQETSTILAPGRPWRPRSSFKLWTRIGVDYISLWLVWGRLEATALLLLLSFSFVLFFCLFFASSEFSS